MDLEKLIGEQLNFALQYPLVNSHSKKLLPKLLDALLLEASKHIIPDIGEPQYEPGTNQFSVTLKLRFDEKRLSDALKIATENWLCAQTNLFVNGLMGEQT